MTISKEHGADSIRRTGVRLKVLFSQHSARAAGSLEYRAAQLYRALKNEWLLNTVSPWTGRTDDVAFAAYLNGFWGGPWDASGAQNVVKDAELFWLLFVMHYVNHDAPFAAIAQIKQSMLGRGRLSVPLARRTFWASFLRVCDRLAMEGTFAPDTKVTSALVSRIVAETEQDTAESLTRLQKNVGRDSRVTLYRGFAVPPTASIRVGRTLVNNANAYQQEWGRGLSYSLRREVATGFALHRVRKDPDDRRTYEPLVAPYGYSVDQMLAVDAKPAIAKFSANQEDVVLVASRYNQDEVIIDPATTRLERYHFVNAAEEKATARIFFE